MLSYPLFHAVFVLPPIAGLGYSLHRLRRQGRLSGRFGADQPRSAAAGVGLIALVALAYTAPWDNHLIREGVWWYGDGAVVGTLGWAPVSEYLFFVLQPVLTALWLYHLPRRETAERPVNARYAGVLVWLGLTAAGNAAAALPAGEYLGAILVWACPVIAFQWFVGGNYLWRARRGVALGILVPTLYLCLADRVAIGLGIWTISAAHSTGLTLLGLPVEEAVFFLLTNVLLVQGLVLLFWVLRRWRPAADGSALRAWSGT